MTNQLPTVILSTAQFDEHNEHMLPCLYVIVYIYVCMHKDVTLYINKVNNLQKKVSHKGSLSHTCS